MVTITDEQGKQYKFAKGTSFSTIVETLAEGKTAGIAAVIVNGCYRGLQFTAQEDCQLRLVPTSSSEGMRVYLHTLLYVFLTAVRHIDPTAEVEVMNTIGKNLYCELHQEEISTEFISKTKLEMQRLIAAKLPIGIKSLTKAEALASIKPRFNAERLPLIEAMPEDLKLIAYTLEDDLEYFIGRLFPDTGYLQGFGLQKYHRGILLRLPEPDQLDYVSSFMDKPKLGKVYADSEKWGNKIGCSTVAKLNSLITAGKAREIIQVSEGLHEKNIAYIADYIAEHSNDVKLILIAGPSSSGKTTFAQRLSVQLRVNGLEPHALSLDNYFKDRHRTPRKRDGSYDYECLEALDLELFNQQLQQLLAGETVQIPHYSFKTGLSEAGEQRITLGERGVLVVEGIHGLNEKLTASVEHKHKLKLYISALTPLSFDDYNRISTSDMRLLRRMVRDSQFRSKDAQETLREWPNVRAGEEKYIFPFAESADMMFNTTLIYEIAALKKYAEPLLEAIPPTAKEHTEAMRLRMMLYTVLNIDEEPIPKNSIMKEFLGASIFKELL